MARTNPPPKPTAGQNVELGPPLDDQRWDYAPPPAIAWNQHIWPPDEALCGDFLWSAMLQMRVNDFRRLVKGLGVRQLKAGKTVFVLSRDLRTALFPNPTPTPMNTVPSE